MRGVKLLYGASVFMALGFCIHMLIDYHTYCTTLNSAPFWVWVLVDAILWLLPALIAFLAGLIVSRKCKEKRK